MVNVVLVPLAEEKLPLGADQVVVVISLDMFSVGVVALHIGLVAPLIVGTLSICIGAVAAHTPLVATIVSS